MMQLQVLIVAESGFRSYGQAIAAAIRNTSHLVSVSEVTDWETLQIEVSQFDMYLLICSSVPIPHSTVADSPAWVQLSTDPNLPSQIKVGERYYDSLNPSLEELLSVLKEAERIFSNS